MLGFGKYGQPVEPIFAAQNREPSVGCYAPDILVKIGHEMPVDGHQCSHLQPGHSSMMSPATGLDSISPALPHQVSLA